MSRSHTILTISQRKRQRISSTSDNEDSPFNLSEVSYITPQDSNDADEIPSQQHDIAMGPDSEAEEDEDAQEDQAVVGVGRRLKENQAAENGIIEEIICTNFMCHTKLSVKLGPLINFIIGHNGSGKSAVLTALTLCLGGKATATNRGQSMKSFIKEGQEFVIRCMRYSHVADSSSRNASLSVRIKNQGSSAYKPELYGKSIIVERHFSKSGATAFKIKNAEGRIISTKRGDLEDISDFFALQLDNPMNVLTQDMARQFLNNSSAADKYKFFIKGTQLEQLDNDYKLMEESLDLIEPRLEAQNEAAQQLKRNYKALQKKVQLADAYQTLVDKQRELGRQHAWGQVEEQERVSCKSCPGRTR
jgi:structural maintenance of chromosomes protein 6